MPKAISAKKQHQIKKQLSRCAENKKEKTK
jgi:hypothetical protein